MNPFRHSGWPSFHHIICETGGSRGGAPSVVKDGRLELQQGGGAGKSLSEVLLKRAELKWGGESFPETSGQVSRDSLGVGERVESRSIREE